MSVFSASLLQIPFGQLAVGVLKTLPLLLTTAAGLSVMSLGSCSTTPKTTFKSAAATPEGELFGNYMAGLYASHVFWHGDSRSDSLINDEIDASVGTARCR